MPAVRAVQEDCEIVYMQPASAVTHPITWCDRVAVIAVMRSLVFSLDVILDKVMAHLPFIQVYIT